jgi:CO/xanthine dehydrogenase Mo-binding subunit
LDLTEAALRRGNGVEPPGGQQWRTGQGIGLAMIATIPPRGHFSEAALAVDAGGRYTISVGTAEFGNGTTTVHTQIAASAMNTQGCRVSIQQSDTDGSGYDTGAFGSAGIVVAGKALLTAAAALTSMLQQRCAVRSGVPADRWAPYPDGMRAGDRSLSFAELVDADQPLQATGRHDGDPRSLAFNVHGFRVAVNTVTGEVRILQSVQAADAGYVMNPEQCRGQIEGGVAQAIGSSLFEEMIMDGQGRVTTSVLRNYHIPQLADLPTTEIYFAETRDDLGPFGAKSMSESPYNPVAPALANAIKNAIGIRPYELPMSRDRIWRLLRP